MAVVLKEKKPIEAFKSVELDQFVDFFNGKSIKAQEYGKYPVYGSNGKIGWTDEYKYDDSIILGRVGAYCGSVEYCQDRFWASDNTIVVKPTTKSTNVKFLYYLLKHQNLNRYAGGSAQPLLTQTTLKAVKVEVPSPEVQQKIAAILSAYDDLIENNLRRIKLLEDMAQALYREWFVYFRYPGHEQVPLVDSSLGPIPQGWEVKPLKDFGNVITGKTPSKKEPENFGDDVPFIKIPDMHGNLFCLDTEEKLSSKGAATQKNKTLPPNSLCVSCIGTAGLVAITDKPSQTNQQINSIVLNNSSHREFLYFRLLDLKETINNYGSNGATIVNLNKGKFEVLEIVVPTLSLTDEFNAKVTSVFELIKILQKKDKNLCQTRDLLLPRLISGQLDVSALEVG